jgi:aromatic ring-cleaving dioxygenase
MIIKHYHFHLYYELENLSLAADIRKEVNQAFDLEVGRLWEKPVGPHPVCSCQVTVPVDKFEEVTAWFLKNRKGIDLFIHPVSGDDILDHSDSIMWIGKSYKLNTDFFGK